MPSTASKIAAQFACSAEKLPDKLYRVRYSGNQSLKARTRPAFKSTRAFKQIVELHLKWCSCEPTPFVSLFATESHAASWAQHLLEHGYRDVVILEIDPSRLSALFRVWELVDRKDVSTTLPQYMYDDEFLVLRKIPRRSIVNKTAVARDDAVELEDESDYDSSDSDGMDSDVVSPL
jgi:hypothetical protein